MAKGGTSALHVIFLVGLLLAVLATLGVSIASLVNILNNKGNNNNNNNNNPASNDVNVPTPLEIGGSDDRYSSFNDIVKLLKTSVNTSINPCDDFYAYTCGAFNGDMGFDISDTININNMVSQLLNDNYIRTSPLPVQKTATFFKTCTDAMQNWNALVADGSQVTNAINRYAAGAPGFTADTQFPFPMLNQDKDVKTFPNKNGLGYLIGQLVGGEGIYTLVSPYVDTNWKDPTGPDGYAFFIDQPSTFRPYTYYVKDWDNTNATLTASITATMNLLAQTTLNKGLDQKILAQDVNDIVTLDYLLATQFSTDETTRRQSDRSYNPNTINQLNALYQAIQWHMLVPLATGPADSATGRVLGDPTYNFFIVMEPDMLTKLLNALVAGNPYGITPRAVVNYFYYRLVDAYSSYLPWPETSTAKAARFKIEKRPLGRPKHVAPEKQKYTPRQARDVTDAQFNCAGQTIDYMMYANARLLIDKIYDGQAARQAIREHVAKVATSIVVGFRSMIDQLKWMTPATKRGAYAKMDNLVKNIAYPDWITDDNALSAYHATLNISAGYSYFDMVYNANQFNLFVSWDSLVKGPVDRTDFNGPPGITNAWYQPELNSITFPAGILKQPFYDYSWPAAFNFGSMGVIAGHELTHGFDDEGVQWNGVGALSGWMDDPSLASFNKMAQCVVDEYSGFCPLNKTVYGAAACVDGAQTQGENIADNGGIQAAFRAYRNYVSLYGSDPTLPDAQYKDFSADQLFFLAFAQVWCENTSTNRLLRQILVDPHSPSVYRVWGTIQNFPEFKSAFNCPTSAYAPDKHCDVWVSDIDPTWGQPVVKNDLNTFENTQITSRDVPKYTAFKQAVDYYTASVDVTANPCDDFWKYACGKFNKSVSFYTARAQNLIYMANQLQDPNYQATIQASTALVKEKKFFDECVKATVDSATEDQLLIANNYIMKKVNKLATLLGQNFTMVFGGTVSGLPSAKQLADALGYLSFEEAIDTLLTPLVDTNWVDNSQGYRMFVDQNTAYLSKTYYYPKAWAIEQPVYYATALNVVTRFARLEAAGTTSNSILNDTINFEQVIAQTYSTDDTTRRAFNRSWNLQSVADLNGLYPFVDWPTYLQHAPTPIRSIVTNSTYQISFMEVDTTKKLSGDYKNFDATKLVNYLFLRLLLGTAQYLPAYKVDFQGMPDEGILAGLKRRKPVPNYKFPPQKDANAPNGPGCAGTANNMMQFANGRVFIDYMYPKQSDVDNVRDVAGGIIQNVITTFQGMVDQLDWMDPDTKSKAYDKTVQIKRNVAFPDWIRDNKALDQYYSDLVIDDKDNYYDIFDKLVKFNILVQYRQLLAAETDRSDFLGQPGTVNAWYQPELNSITFPAGILVPPYFHPMWPPSINYGGMGLVAGHELTHGFDDQGVQWGPTGNLKQWMNDNSTIGFNTMAQCVIDEYGKFCPLDANKYQPNCVLGDQTQGENIADNGGIHAAFRAYQTHQSLDGPDPMLPDRLMGQFSHDQLFFLNFAQVWCEVRRSDDELYKQIMNDPHSPSMYRVFGTIQNFPAFKTAYNCPDNSAYAPDTHCSVWVPKKYQ